MEFRSTARARLVLTGLAVAGALAGSAGAASAQYYLYEEEAYPRDYYRRYVPVPPSPIPPRALGRVAAREFGLAQIDRTVRTRSSYIVDGQTLEGRRERLIFDVYSGDLVDRIVLQGKPRGLAPVPRVARVDPRDDERPSPRVTPRPPERPPVLKPPGQASAPATIVPPSPAAPPRAAEPQKPTEAKPATASAPAAIPVAPNRLPVPTPGSVDPATGAPKPQLVNPNDVRGTSEPERKPPLARADPSGITVAPVQLPPVQLEDATPSKPRAETPAVPVVPLD